MSGTRYNSRGSDNMGNVANYVQSEQLMFVNDKLFTFFQIRGSLPFYWEQKEGLINPKAEIHQRREINEEAVSKHIAAVLGARFDNVVFLNLLQRSRSDEEQLTKYLESLLGTVIGYAQFKGKVGYEHIDFHALTKGNKFANVNPFVYSVLKKASANGDRPGLSVFEQGESPGTMVQRQRQASLIRTNCLDCLDRTNAVQTKLGLYSLYLSLQSAKHPLYNELSSDECLDPLSAMEVS